MDEIEQKGGFSSSEFQRMYTTDESKEKRDADKKMYYSRTRNNSLKITSFI
jgi:hypothetical protein